jgi:hypothetical protein
MVRLEEGARRGGCARIGTTGRRRGSRVRESDSNQACIRKELLPMVAERGRRRGAGDPLFCFGRAREAHCGLQDTRPAVHRTHEAVDSGVPVFRSAEAGFSVEKLRVGDPEARDQQEEAAHASEAAHDEHSWGADAADALPAHEPIVHSAVPGSRRGRIRRRGVRRGIPDPRMGRHRRHCPRQAGRHGW